MSWILLTLILAATITVGGFIDNYASDVVFKKRRAESFQATSAIIYAILIAIILIFVGLQNLAWWHIAVFVLAGALDGAGNIPYFKALKFTETTTATILRQTHAIFALVAGFLVLGQNISPLQLVAFIFILGAAVAALLGGNKNRLKLGRNALFLMLFAIFVWVISETIFVLAFNHADGDYLVGPSAIWTPLFWFSVGKGVLSGTLGFGLKSWRVRLKNVWIESPKNLALSVLGAHSIRVGADYLWRYIITIAPIALATAVNNVSRLFLTFGFGLAFSLVWPTFGREKITKKAVLHHLIGVVLAAIGVVLLQIHLN
ncbi:MAG: hypothetical protein LBM12_03170 [Candidatus Nomurabacteria bacterium]|jgi:drug/metabolite transporter (DMT)-like permease|nr:hypothetical protein [Candidatus Nomurabacteria bacterium]